MIIRTLIFMLALLVGAGAAWAQSTSFLLPNAEQQFADANGAPYANGSVFFYIPGTSTPKTTWQDQGLTTPNANPVRLNAAGRAQIWGAGSYRQVLFDQFGTLVWDQVTFGPTVPSVPANVVSGPGVATLATDVMVWADTSGTKASDPGTTTSNVQVRTQATSQNGLLGVSNFHTANTPIVSSIGSACTSVGNNTDFEGCIGVFGVAIDDPSTTLSNKGVLYGGNFDVKPIVARGNTPFDDVDGLVVSNTGSASGTEGLFMGHGVSGGGNDWIATITLDAWATYGIRYGNGHMVYGMDFVAGGPVISGGPIRLQNNSFLLARNAANSGDLGLIGLSAGNVAQVGNVGINEEMLGGLLIDGATPTAAPGVIGLGTTLVAAGAGTCPSGTVGGQTVLGCWQISRGGTPVNVPFF